MGVDEPWWPLKFGPDYVVKVILPSGHKCSVIKEDDGGFMLVRWFNDGSVGFNHMTGSRATWHTYIELRIVLRGLAETMREQQ